LTLSGAGSRRLWGLMAYPRRQLQWHATETFSGSKASGLPEHHNYFYESEPVRPPPTDNTVRRYGNLVTAPGERYHYANLGYGILGHVIERVSGRTFVARHHPYSRGRRFLYPHRPRGRGSRCPGSKARELR
jgi:hypothetical protein